VAENKPVTYRGPPRGEALEQVKAIRSPGALNTTEGGGDEQPTGTAKKSQTGGVS